MPAETFNGYTNFETFSVVVWIDNTDYISRSVLAKVSEITRLIDGESKRQTEFCNWLMDFVGAKGIPSGLPDLAGPLLSAAIQKINWRELTETYLGRA